LPRIRVDAPGPAKEIWAAEEDGAVELTRAGERERIEKSFDVFGLGPRERAEILEAMDSTDWDWFRHCDGCTAVSELYWPTPFFPPCLRHDFDWIRGDGGWTACRRFFRLQRAYRVPRWRAALRTAGVLVAWYAWGRWRRGGCGGGTGPRDR